MADQYNSAHTGAEIDQAVADVQNNKAAWSSKPQPSATTPKEPGTASAGSESAYARGDHVHPHDGTKINNPTEKADGQVLTYDAASGMWIAKETAGGKQIYMTEYEGTGTYGSGNPNTLTFDFVPALIFILPTATGNRAYEPAIFTPGLIRTAWLNRSTSDGNTYFGIYRITWSDNLKTVSWYLESLYMLSTGSTVRYNSTGLGALGALGQLNSNNLDGNGAKTYRVIALRSE